MPSEFKLPELGENITSGTVSRVLVAAGDIIASGRNVIEIETDKAVAEIPCTISGKVLEVRVQEGGQINVGDVILVLDESAADDAAKADTQPEQDQEASAATTKPASAVETAPPSAQQQPTPDPAPSTAQAGKVRAAPSVRKLAREHDVELHSVPASDPSGKISAQDVRAFIAKRDAGGQPTEQTEPPPDSRPDNHTALPVSDNDSWGPVATEPMNAIRKKAADHLALCWTTIPHVTHFDKADITALEAFRRRYAAKAEQAGIRLTVTAFLLKLLPEALKRYPRFNASIDMENKTIIYKRYYHLGVAVDTQNGLVVPVLRDVDKKDVAGISRELAELAAKARDRKLTLEDMRGATFTVSNLGGLGGTSFTPIINAPETAILGVSRAETAPVYDEGEFRPRLMLPLSLSYDHRVIDGADAARFLRFVAEALEEPWRLMLGL